MRKSFPVFILLIILFLGCSSQNEDEREIMKQKIDQFSVTKINYDESLLDENQKMVVQKLHESAKVMDEIFLEQVYSQNFEIRDRLQNETDELSKLQLQYFTINFGPFDRLDNNRPFIGDKEKPLGANFYPEDITKEEFENWIADHPDDEEAFRSEFTVIRRTEDGLIAIPYSEFYKDNLEKAASLLREAAEYADNETLKNYLLKRATAFETNDYYESDMAWMDLKNHDIEVIIGPYEVYEDELFNYKASFECFLTLVDPQETQKLKVFAGYLREMEDNLPIPDEHKNFDRGSDSPIVVAQEIFSAGDTKAGVQTLAFNLPNDERVRKAKGSKKVLLKNLHEAKFEKLLYPIAKRVLDKDQLQYVTFNAFFNHTLMHEMSHGIGPGFITVDGRETDVQTELKETYSKLEECKADILGMFNNMLMIEKGVYPKEFEKQLWSTFLAGIFRSVRFGIDAAHGAGNAIIYNYLLENGAYQYNEKTNKVKVDYNKIYDVLKDLANKVLMIQAAGDYDGAKALIAQYAVNSPSMLKLKEQLADLPVDIWPEFAIEEK